MLPRVLVVRAEATLADGEQAHDEGRCTLIRVDQHTFLGVNGRVPVTDVQCGNRACSSNCDHLVTLLADY